MKTIREICGHKKVNGLFGVEIEIESNQNFLDFDYSGMGFNYTHDDSLRGRYTGELVFNKPKTLNQSKKCLSVLQEFFEEHSILIEDHGRSGTHIHVNVNDLTPAQVIMFSFYWYIVEDILIKWSGPSRQNNMFAVPFSISNEISHPIEQLANYAKLGELSANHFSYLFPIDSYKYSGLNWCRLYDLGTLETRIWGPSNFDQTSKALDILYNIKQLALEGEDLLGISERYSMQSTEEFLGLVFGEHLSQILHDTGIAKPMLSSMVRDAFWRIQMCLRTCVRNLQPRGKKKYSKKPMYILTDEPDLDPLVQEFRLGG